MWKTNIHDDNTMTTSKVSNDVVTSQLLKAARYFRQGRIGESNDILNNLGGIIETRSQRGRFHALVRGINNQRTRINHKKKCGHQDFRFFRLKIMLQPSMSPNIASSKRNCKGQIKITRY